MVASHIRQRKSGIAFPVVQHLTRLDIHYKNPRGYNAAIYYPFGYKNTANGLCCGSMPPCKMLNTANIITIFEITNSYQKKLQFFLVDASGIEPE